MLEAVTRPSYELQIKDRRAIKTMDTGLGLPDILAAAHEFSFELSASNQHADADETVPQPQRLEKKENQHKLS